MGEAGGARSQPGPAPRRERAAARRDGDAATARRPARPGRVGAKAPPGARERMLAAATTLLRRSGLSGAGINEIVRESGAPKGSVYHHFPGGKAQIVTEALAAHALAVGAFVDRAMAGRRTPPARVRALFEAFADRVEQGAFLLTCPAGTVCLDLEAGMDDLRVAVAGSFRAYREAIERHLPEHSVARRRAFAGLAVTAIEGAYLRARAERSGEAFREAGAWLARMVA